MVPASGYLDAVGVCLLYLFAAPVDVVAGTVIADVVRIAVIRLVHLLHFRPRPSGIPFRVAEYLFRLCTVRIEPGIRSIEARPFPSVDDAVVIGRWRVVTQGFRTGIPAVDIPSLGVVLPRRLFQVIAYPRGEVVVVYLKEVGHALRPADHRKQRVGHAVFQLPVQVVCVSGHPCDVAHLSV